MAGRGRTMNTMAWSGQTRPAVAGRLERRVRRQILHAASLCCAVPASRTVTSSAGINERHYGSIKSQWIYSRH